jgi:hypothetical protein
MHISEDSAHLADSIVQSENSEQIDGVIQFQECRTQYYRGGKELFNLRVFKYYGDPNDSTAIWTFYDENGQKIKTIEISKSKIECPEEPKSPMENWILIGPDGKAVARKKVKQDSIFFLTYWREVYFTDTLDTSRSISNYCGKIDERQDSLWYNYDHIMREFVYYENGVPQLRTYYRYQFDQSGQVSEVTRVDSSAFLKHTTTERNIYRDEIPIPLFSIDYENEDISNARTASWIYDDNLQLIDFRLTESGFLVSFTKMGYDSTGKQIYNYSFNGDSTLLKVYNYSWKESRRTLECWQKSSDSLNIYSRIDTSWFLGRKKIRSYHSNFVTRNGNYTSIRRSGCQLDRVVRYDKKGRILEAINYDFNTGGFQDITKWRYLKSYRKGVSSKYWFAIK